jgi:hypothetical protein
MVEIGFKKNKNDKPKYYHILYNRDYFGGYYNLYNIRSEYIYKAKEESKLYAINKIDFLKLLKKFPIIEKHMRKNVYNKFKRGVKFQMDKSIQKDYQNLEIINEDDNEINTNKKKIDNSYKPKEMLDIHDNKNGMSINTILSKTIKEKKNQIEELENQLEEKYLAIQKEFEKVNDEYYKLIQKIEED